MKNVCFNNLLRVIAVLTLSFFSGCYVPPHTEPDPPVVDPDIQNALFSAIEADDKAQVIAIANDHPVELETPVQYKKFESMTPLYFAVSQKKYAIAHELLSTIDVRKLNIWHSPNGDNVISLILKTNKTQHKGLYRWPREFIKSGDKEQINFLLEDATTLKLFKTNPKIRRELEKRRDLKIDFSRTQRTRLKPIGIHNRGASCYANSVMQLLMLLPQTYWDQAKTKLVDDKAAVKKNVLSAKELKFFDKVMDFRQNYMSSLATEDGLRQKVGVIIDTGVGEDLFNFGDKYGQQDAQEFFQPIGDLLFNSAKQKTFILTSHIIATHNGKKIDNVNKEPRGLFIISPELPKNGKTTLQQTVDEYFKTERMTGADKYNLKGTLVDAEKYLRLSGEGEYLFLQLKRFSSENKKSSRNDSEVDFSNETIDLTKHIEPTPAMKAFYEIIGVSLQSGSLTGGHYTARVKYGNQWYIANDSDIQPTNWAEVRDSAKVMSYLILLRRVKK